MKTTTKKVIVPTSGSGTQNAYDNITAPHTPTPSELDAKITANKTAADAKFTNLEIFHKALAYLPNTKIFTIRQVLELEKSTSDSTIVMRADRRVHILFNEDLFKLWCATPGKLNWSKVIDGAAMAAQGYDYHTRLTDWFNNVFYNNIYNASRHGQVDLDSALPIIYTCHDTFAEKSGIIPGHPPFAFMTFATDMFQDASALNRFYYDIQPLAGPTLSSIPVLDPKEFADSLGLLDDLMEADMDLNNIRNAANIITFENYINVQMP